MMVREKETETGSRTVPADVAVQAAAHPPDVISLSSEITLA